MACPRRVLNSRNCIKHLPRLLRARLLRRLLFAPPPLIAQGYLRVRRQNRSGQRQRWRDIGAGGVTVNEPEVALTYPADAVTKYVPAGMLSVAYWPAELVAGDARIGRAVHVIRRPAYPRTILHHFRRENGARTILKAIVNALEVLGRCFHISRPRHLCAKMRYRRFISSATARNRKIKSFIKW